MAASIASLLSGGSHSTRTDSGIATHEYTGSWRGKRAMYRVTAVRGHVYNLDFEEAYQSWEQDPTLLFGAPTVKTPTSGGVCAQGGAGRLRTRRPCRRANCT